MTLSSFAVIVLLPNLLVMHGGPPPFMPPPGRMEGMPPPPALSLLVDVGHQLFLFLAVFFFSLILKINNRWKQAEQEKLNAELSYLKAQINPHFLFNILNNIYSLSIEKSDEAPTAVIKLSGMMRYVLQDAGHHLVPLSREIDYMKDYITLQRIRFGATLPLILEVLGLPSGQLVPPLILISFVENAFKYGINASEDADIRISLQISETELHFNVFNKKVTFHEMPAAGSGLGIENTKKRLQLLYPGRHQLEIRDETNQFNVSLLLQLT